MRRMLNHREHLTLSPLALLAFSLITVTTGSADDGLPVLENTGLQASSADCARGNWVINSVYEEDHGADLNGDGVLDDRVYYLHNLASGTSKPLGAIRTHQGDRSCTELASNHTIGRGSCRDCSASLAEQVFVFAADEHEQGDLNSDGDSEDFVVHLYDFRSQSTQNLGLAVDRYVFDLRGRDPWQLSHPTLQIFVSEFDQGEDLNADGALDGIVEFVHDLETGVSEPVLESAEPDLPIDCGESGRQIVSVSERELQRDLNRDRDKLDDDVLHLYSCDTEETINLEICGTAHSFSTGVGVARVTEQNTDLNGDGDTTDTVWHLIDFTTAEVINLGTVVVEPDIDVSEHWLAFKLRESSEGADLNGDGDTRDFVLHLFDARTRDFINLLDTGRIDILSEDWMVVFDSRRKGLIAYDLHARTHRALNFSGSALLLVGDWLVAETRTQLHLRNLRTEASVDLDATMVRSQFQFDGENLFFAVDEGSRKLDLNGDADTEDSILHVLRFPSTSRFLHGDCDGDGDACSGVNDALTLLSWLFLGRTTPPCLAACDPDGNGELELADAVYGLNFCFQGTDAPVAPFPECGTGTDSTLGCETSGCE